MKHRISKEISMMGYIKEPEGVDFEVDSRPLKDWEKSQISDVIAHYKKTGEIKKISKQRRKKVIHATK